MARDPRIIFPKSTGPDEPAPAKTDRASSAVNPPVTRHTRRRPISRGRLWLFRLIAMVGVPICFLACVELGLRMAGVGYPTSFMVRSEDQPEHLIDNYKFAWRFFPRALSRSSQPIFVSAEKPAATRRIVVFGGSAAMGDPEPAYGMSRMLEVLLEQRFAGQDFEVINAAVTAINSHVVLQIARDCRVLDADAWVVYLGNNEVHGPFGSGTVFGGRDVPLSLIRTGLALRRTRLGQVISGEWTDPGATPPKSWGGMAMFLNQQVRRSDPSLERVYENLEQNLRDVISTGIRAGTPVVVSSVVTNLRDCPPFISLHDTALAEDDLQRWDELYHQGCDAQDLGLDQQAVETFNACTEIDASFAELHYRLAQSLHRLEQLDLAREHFQRARDEDALRFRADTRINQTISRVAGGFSDLRVTYVDADLHLAAQNADGVIGAEFLHEHVHLNFAGNYEVAKRLADSLCEVLELKADADNPTWISRDTCAKQLGFTTLHRRDLAREMKSRLSAPPFNEQLGHEQRDAALDTEIARLSSQMTASAATEADAQFQTLIDARPGDMVLRKQYASLLESMGKYEDAVEQWRAVTQRLSHSAESFCQLGIMLNRAELWTEAEAAFMRAMELRPNYARAANSLGICLSHQDKFEASYAQFRRAVQLRPSYAEAYYNWGLVLANQGSQDAALERFRDATEADANYLPAVMRLGKHYSEQGDFATAAPFYQDVVRLRPRDAAARVNFGLVCLKLEKFPDAIEHLERAVELEPSSQLARQALARARKLAAP